MSRPTYVLISMPAPVCHELGLGPRSSAIFVLASVALLVGCSRAAHEDRRDPTPLPAAAVSYGTAMSDVARRFELLGRAAAARRFELADYELGELAEIFEETLPHAALPREGHPEVLGGLVHAFVATSLPDLQRAIAARDPVRFAQAFERNAAACNACHRASGHGFIEVPTVPGESIPKTDPVIP